MHKRIADIRRNTLHQLTTYLVKHFSEIVIEDLNVKEMLSNHHLARHIADVGFYEFRRQLAYKCEFMKSALVIAGRWYPSSKLYSDCKKHNPDLKLSDRVFHCRCGNHKCRDYNASINLENV